MLKVVPFDSTLNKFTTIRDFTISNSGDQAFFTIQSANFEISQIVSVQKEKEGWSEPQLMNFCDSFRYLEPFLTPDQLKLYFVSDRPLNESDIERKDFDIWYVEREEIGEEWSDPINLGKPVNSELDEFYPSLSANNNLYFTLVSPEGKGLDDIFIAQWNGSSYEEPKILSDSINTEGYEFNAFISPDENILLFTKWGAKGGIGSGDLYFSTKENGVWSNSKNLGVPINTPLMEYCPFYHAPSGTLYFTSRRSNLKGNNFKNVNELEHYLNITENGFSKIYMVKIPLPK